MRAITAPLVLAAAVGIPYAATHKDQLKKMWNSESKTEAPSLPTAETFTSTSAPHAVSQANGLKPAAPAGQVRSFPLAEVIRFDVSRGWVIQRWQRKTTSLADLNLFGVRVPLITGTNLQDLAGSLTYYFDSQGLVQRISLVGSTGNTTQLETLVSQRYGLQLQGTPIAGRRVYQVRQGDAVLSELLIRPAFVLNSNSPHESFTVDLQLQRPGVATPLPLQSLPTANLTAQQPSKTTPSEEAASQTAAQESENVDEKKSDEPFWRAYMPRSQVPEEQIENLERRGRF